MAENYTNNMQDQAHLIEALQWHIDNGVDEMLLDEPQDRTAIPKMPKKQAETPKVGQKPAPATGFHDNAPQKEVPADMMGAAQAIVEAQNIAAGSKNLDELKQAIQDFEGLSIRKTATNIVFSDGNPKASVMVIGDSPEAEDDIQGKAFIGPSGQLLDRILACIDLDRTAEDLAKAAYLSNVLNWRPPGNRTPSQAEIDISLPFLERHIALVKPKMIILCGGVPAKALLRSNDSISKLRGKFHDYQLADGTNIPAMVTYHPTYLLSTPAQKKAVWADMLMFQEKLTSL